MHSDDVTIIHLPGAGYEDGMIALGDTIIGPRCVPMPWKAKAIVVVLGSGSFVELTREQALEVAEAIRSAAHDG